MRWPLALLLLAAPAAATKVAVVAPSGAPDTAVQDELLRALGEKFEVVAVAEWDAAARKLGVTGRGADDLSAIANQVKAQLVVTGAFKGGGADATLQLSIRDGATGKSVEKMRYPLRGGKVDRPALRRIADEVVAAVERAGGTKGEAPQAAPAKPEEEEEELAPAKATPARTEVTATKSPGRIDRPQWTPFVDASVGLVVSGRLFGFDAPGQNLFASTVAQGLRLDLNGYPLAALATRPGGAVNAITGLGIGLTFDGIFWPDAVPCTKDTMGACVATMDRFSVREYRVETGLRWHWNPFQKPDAPELLASLQYGWHATTVAKRGSGALVGPPDVAYHYLTVGIGARIPFAHFIGISPRVHVHAPFTAGDLQSPSQYGGGSLWGVRAGGHLELTLWEGLTLYLGGFYERFGISIGAGATKVVTGGATDQYYGAIASIGYVDHRGALPDTDRDGTSDGSDRCPTEAGPRDNGGCPLADGDGDGTPDRDDRCPKVAGPKAFRGCPDKDGDGLTDAEDRCPDTAGSKELSGCLDADGDGLVDPEDDCPTAPGDKANRGCPTYRTVKVTGERIEISEKIFFAYDKTDILPKSFELLDDVVRALGDHPHIRVRIDGHTDASGSEARNQELSEGRARAVRDYLVGHGIAEDRLEAKGHGSQYPIDSNKTLSGRENNRRVEFVIVKEKKERE